ncbi:methyltransferase [Rubellimicrobium rubrum]|uniref:Methyltransferase n=1 Tax=Rubellimicrobium rubrum TaxID=2585369 RepID=A0A5C4MQ33_9RHOB|nr:50S ribosomal protein L11 methyltransferase [Rubellimicrobium rubrum]TNC48010.1 methyltransferase [Rubellimicrobium rubrum]
MTGSRSLSARAEQRATEFIRANLPLTEVSGTGILLHCASPSSGLTRLVPPGETPYWAYAWPGGVALALHVLVNPDTVRGHDVVEVGAGSGIVSLAALKAGAQGALAFDMDPLAALASRLNAQANDLMALRTTTELAALRLELKTDHPDRRPVVLAGDVFYSDETCARMTSEFDALVESADILVADIGRRFLPRDRLQPIASYPVRDVGDPASAPVRDGWVYRWLAP